MTFFPNRCTAAYAMYWNSPFAQALLTAAVKVEVGVAAHFIAMNWLLSLMIQNVPFLDLPNRELSKVHAEA